MPTVLDQSTLFSIVHLEKYTGQASVSQAILDHTSSISLPLASFGDYNTTSKITTGFNYYYKMQGYNTSTQRYEVWHSMGAPLFDPPSGHSLENITLVASWIDR